LVDLIFDKLILQFFLNKKYLLKIIPNFKWWYHKKKVKIDFIKQILIIDKYNFWNIFLNTWEFFYQYRKLFIF
jgi:hypothetical protein